jgi:hypothetical protein
MFGIHSRDINGQDVALAPFGIEGDPAPCLIFYDPNPLAMVRHSKVIHDAGKVVTATTLRGLQSAALKLGLRLSKKHEYVP